MYVAPPRAGLTFVETCGRADTDGIPRPPRSAGEARLLRDVNFALRNAPFATWEAERLAHAFAGGVRAGAAAPAAMRVRTVVVTWDGRADRFRLEEYVYVFEE